MKPISKLFFVLLFILFFAKPSFSTHIIGGELIYKCLYYDSTLNKGYYKFTMKLYRECSPYYETENCGMQPISDFDNQIYVAVYNSNNVLVQNFVMPVLKRDTIDNNTYNICLYAPPGVCVEQATYEDKFWLPDYPGGYSVTYERCCRNWELTNIVLPPCPTQPDVGSAWSLTIPDTAQAVCNSSPVYNLYPPSIICWNAPFVYDHSATDPEGDSLVYELCSAFDFDETIYGVAPNPSLPPNNYFQVPYDSGYSPSYPMDALSNDSFKINRQTGLLTGTATDTGRYALAVCVSEYRNGVLLSTNKRDFQFNTAKCSEDANMLFSSIPNTNNYLTMKFNYLGNPAATFNWDFGVNASVTDTSTMENPTYSYPDTGTYPVMLIINENLSCADTIVILVTISSPIFIEETENKYSISVSPIPSDGLLSIQFNLDHVVTMKVRNLLGQIIYNENIETLINKEIKTLDLRNLPGGMYFIEFEICNNQQFSYQAKKIILER